MERTVQVQYLSYIETHTFKVHDTDNVTFSKDVHKEIPWVILRQNAGGRAAKPWIFRAKACMRPTITAALWFPYERLLRVVFGTANPS